VVWLNRLPKDFSGVVIEGAGGLYSPIAQQVLNSELAVVVNLPIVIVDILH
jgi:dethiobiotin synthetase